MKSYAIQSIVIAVVFSFSCFAQSGDSIPLNSKIDYKELMVYKKSHDKLVPVVLFYHVEERINMNFGGRITTYNVPNLDLINTNDLGPNNTRIITPKYANPKAQSIATLENEQLQFSIDTITIAVDPDDLASINRRDKKMYIYINILNTYERILERGYVSVEMLKRVGDRHYFDGNYALSAKWYNELFGLTTDLEVEYYYRYAKSLIAIGENKKGKEMMKLFEERNVRK